MPNNRIKLKNNFSLIFISYLIPRQLDQCLGKKILHIMRNLLLLCSKNLHILQFKKNSRRITLQNPNRHRANQRNRQDHPGSIVNAKSFGALYQIMLMTIFTFHPGIHSHMRGFIT